MDLLCRVHRYANPVGLVGKQRRRVEERAARKRAGSDALVDLARTVLHQRARARWRVPVGRIQIDDGREQYQWVGAGRHERDIGQLHGADGRDGDQIDGVGAKLVDVTIRERHAKCRGCATTAHSHRGRAARGIDP